MERNWHRYLVSHSLCELHCSLYHSVIGGSVFVSVREGTPGVCANFRWLVVLQLWVGEDCGASSSFEGDSDMISVVFA